MKRLFSISLLLIFTHLNFTQVAIAEERQDRLLAKKNGFQLLESHLEVYFELTVFIMQKPLSDTDKDKIREKVLTDFQTNPEQVIREFHSLSHTLEYLAKHTEKEVHQRVRENFLEVIIEFHKLGNSNIFSEIIFSNR